jgi:hypothetical protein
MKISYVCLIYKSIDYINFFLQNFYQYTKLNNDDEFYFVANDASDDVLKYLNEYNIPHYIHNNNEEQKKDWYINNVYRAWNTAGKMAKGDYIIFLNSDFGFSENWSENLIKNIRDNICLCSRLVERGREDGGYESGKYGIEKSFGRNPFNYNNTEFNNYANQIKVNELNEGGLFMPLLIKKDYFLMVNGYPEGNISQESDIFNPLYLTKEEVYYQGKVCVSGDVVLMRKLKNYCIQHYTVFDSIVYHIQEGEMKFNELNTEFCFYCSNNNVDVKPIYIFYSNDGRIRTELELFDRNDGWYYQLTLNSFNDNINCKEYFIYRINQNLDLNIFENTVISSASPELFIPNNNYYYLVDKVYFKNYIPYINNLENTVKYYYNNGKINIIK